MPSQKKFNNNKRELHHLIKDIDFTGNSTNGETRIGISPNNKIIEYFRLQKEVDYWYGMNQVKFAKDAERRANALFKGNMKEYKQQDPLIGNKFNYTKKFKERTNY
jgi:hypothetical protein